jgi:serine/threonine-protein phosphatase 4 catalytic subunit
MTASSLTSGGNSCLDEQIERLKRCEYLREGEVKALCLRAREILVDESNVQRVDAPVTVREIVALCVLFRVYGDCNIILNGYAAAWLT